MSYRELRSKYSLKTKTTTIIILILRYRFHRDYAHSRLSSSDFGEFVLGFYYSMEFINFNILKMENFRKPNFELVADVLYWMVKL